jgi:hypothetical protein
VQNFHGYVAFWVFVFHVTKYYELIDTLFSLLKMVRMNLRSGSDQIAERNSFPTYLSSRYDFIGDLARSRGMSGA